jgi:crotonobetainyl-CoA:carnitine CoA-transferase CaiB-like acyl-CoA transferase
MMISRSADDIAYVDDQVISHVVDVVNKLDEHEITAAHLREVADIFDRRDFDALNTRMHMDDPELLSTWPYDAWHTEGVAMECRHMAAWLDHYDKMPQDV